MLKGLETIVYFVDDLAGAAAWYRKVLAIEPNHESPHYVGFTVAGHELGLHPAAGEARPPGSDASAGCQTAYWTVDDIQKVVAAFVEHGATANKIDDVGGGIVIGSVTDPFGNVVGLIQNPHSPNR